MAEKQTLSRPYAKAIFDMAVQDSDDKEWMERLDLLSNIVSDDAIHDLINNPDTGEDKVKDLLFSLAEEVSKNNLDEKSKNLIKLLVSNKRIALIPEISEMFQGMVKKSQGKIEAEVISAFTVEETQMKSISDALTKKYDREVVVNTTVDESLVAGIIIRIGDEVIDGSITTQLEKLTNTLIH